MAASLASLESDRTALQAQLSDLAKAMRLAKAAGQTDALEMFRQQYRAVAQRWTQLAGAASEADAPSGFMVAMDGLRDDIIAGARAAGAKVDDVIDTGLTLAKWVPWLVLGLIVVVGIGVSTGAIKLSARR